MVFLENFRVALGALRANALRSILTTLGIIIGVAAVIAIVSIIQGLQFMVTGQLEDVGANFIFVAPQFQQTQPGMVQRPVTLTWADGQVLEREIPEIDEITPIIMGKIATRYRDRRHEPDFVLGVNEDYPEVTSFFVERGRFFSDIDLRHRRKVAVLGTHVVDELRLGNDPLGKEIYVGDTAATVIGIMEEKGQALGQDYDDLVFVPFDTALTLFGRTAGEQIQLNLKAETSDQTERVRDEIERILRREHDLGPEEPNDFQVMVQDDILEFYDTILGGVTLVLGGIVSIALLVGGIGIMNIMLVSVTERTREIGIRKAVGARKQDVLLQFLIEAITLSLVGGALGLAIGYGIGALGTALLPGDLPPAHVPLWAVALAFGFSLAVGVFFGIYPAGKAAALDPIEALRYE